MRQRPRAAFLRRWWETDGRAVIARLRRREAAWAATGARTAARAAQRDVVLASWSGHLGEGAASGRSARDAAFRLFEGPDRVSAFLAALDASSADPPADPR